MLHWLLHGTIPVGDGVLYGYYPPAGMYLFYGGFCAVGFVTWWRATRTPVPVPTGATSQQGARA